MKEIESETEKEWVYSHHVVAFLDLMGQRQLFQDLPGVPNTPEGVEELHSVLRKTVGFIEQFRKWFEDMFSVFQTNRPIPDAVPSQFHEEFKKLQATEIHMQIVSDAVIAWSPIHTLTEEDLAKAMNSLWGILGTTAANILTSLSLEHPVRGGIEVDGGITIEPGGKEIYGRALNCAYELEQHVAKYPRVVVGKGAVQFIEHASQAAGKPGTERIIAYSRTLAKRCQHLIVKDDDGQYIVHWLGPGAMELHQSVELSAPSAKKELVNMAFKFIDDSVIRFKEDQKLGPRYVRLQEYVKKYSRDWTK